MAKKTEEEPLMLDWDGLVAMLDKDSDGTPVLERVAVEKGERGTRSTTVSLEKDLHIFARAKPHGWLSKVVNDMVREKLKSEPKYIDALERAIKAAKKE